MNTLEIFAYLVLFVQLVHSIEELLAGFHKKWFIFKMSFKFFLGFEIIHNLFWIAVIVFKQFPYRHSLMGFFIILMFAQSLLHIAWLGQVKKYVPGLYTAIIHIVIFLIFYFQIISRY